LLEKGSAVGSLAGVSVEHLHGLGDLRQRETLLANFRGSVAQVLVGERIDDRLAQPLGLAVGRV
jgi:hypothetical protein